MKKAKVIIALAASGGSNPFLDSDNHLNVDRVKALQAKVLEVVKTFPTVNAKGKAVKPPRPEQTFVVKRKAKSTKFSSGSAKKGDLKYLTQRAIKLRAVKRLSEKGAIANMALLTVYEASLMGKLAPQVKQAAAACAKHMKAADKTKTGVTKIKTKLRDESNKVFVASVAAIKKILAAGGIKDKDLVESKGMGGSTLLVNLGGDKVISIGKSDMTKFKTARKNASAAE